MSESETVEDRPNGPDSSKARRRLAITSVVGSIVRLEFTEDGGGGAVEFDATELPGAEAATGMAASLLAYGALAVLQSAYGNAPDNPRAAAENALWRLREGHWTPGPIRRPPPTDPLLQALSEHLGRPVDESYFDRYAAAQGLKTPAAARRDLRAHPDIAPALARIQAERAAAIAASIKDQANKKSLDI